MVGDLKTMLGAAVIVLVSILGGPAALEAGAQDLPSSDPDRGSPSGVIYELPLDTGRQDAAPRTRAGGSPIRSENGFGSSSVVPGGSGSGGGGGSGATGPKQTNTAAAPARDGASGGAAEDRSAPAVDGGVSAADEGGSSLPLALVLLVVTGLVGGGVGIAAAKSRRT
jgi:hypothetical protein